MSKFVKKIVNVPVRVTSGSKSIASPDTLACMKGVRNTSFFHAESRKKKNKQKVYGYMKGRTGTIFKITRRNIKANKNGDNDEREAFRLNKRNGRDQENTLRLRAETPTSIHFFVEGTGKGSGNLKHSSKEEYISKYYDSKGKKIGVGDSIKFNYLDNVDKEFTEEVNGTVKKLSPFKFTLENHRDFMYNGCTEIKVKHNGFFVDGYFKPILI